MLEYAETAVEGGPRSDPVAGEAWWSLGEVAPARENWLLSYVDILTLLLTLLVLLLALQPSATEVVPETAEAAPPRQESTPAPTGVRWPAGTLDLALEPAVPDLMEALAGLPPLPVIQRTPPAAAAPKPPSASPRPPSRPKAPPPAADTPAVPAPAKEGPIDRLLHRLEERRPAEGLRVSRLSGGVSLELRDNILFPQSSAALQPAGRRLLGGLAAVLASHQGMISVEGHTDDRPILNARFPSNWELSAGRATGVAGYLLQKGGAPSHLRAVGYADTRPLEDNATPEGRARNRRVTLILRFGETGEGRPETGGDGG